MVCDLFLETQDSLLESSGHQDADRHKIKSLSYHELPYLRVMKLQLSIMPPRSVRNKVNHIEMKSLNGLEDKCFHVIVLRLNQMTLIVQIKDKVILKKIHFLNRF